MSKKTELKSKTDTSRLSVLKRDFASDWERIERLRIKVALDIAAVEELEQKLV